MIRIVDILKNVGGGENEKEKPQEIRISNPVFSVQETQGLCNSLADALEDVIAKKEAEEEAVEKCKIILMNLEKLVDQQMANKTTVIGAFLEKAECKNKILSHAIKIVIVAIRMGIDVVYNREKLIELAHAALITDLDASNIDTKIFKEILAAKLKASIKISEYDKIIHLAQIY